MGTFAFAVDIGLETLNTWKYNAVRNVIRAGNGFWAPYAVFMAFCLGYSGLSGALVSFGAPLAAGSGIPEVKTYLNGVHIRGALHGVQSTLVLCFVPECPYTSGSQAMVAQVVVHLSLHQACMQDS